MVISTIYAVALLFALLIFGAYTFFCKQREKLFVLLFGAIAIVNLGYLLTSLAASKGFALFANTLAYFGSVFLPMLMLWILLQSLGQRASKTVAIGLLCLSVGVFLLTATQLIPSVDLYYKDVELLQTADGASYLKKEYGPCHFVYLIYLIGYFGSMIYLALSAIMKKKMESGKQTAVLLVAVFVNLCVWFAEQFTSFEFEFLAFSYLISEIFLLIFRQIILENQRLRETLSHREDLKVEQKKEEDPQILAFREGLKSLTPTEKIVLGHYADGKTTAQTLEAMCITQNTLKYHNKNLYSKLFVSSRKELLELYRKANESD